MLFHSFMTPAMSVLTYGQVDLVPGGHAHHADRLVGAGAAAVTPRPVRRAHHGEVEVPRPLHEQEELVEDAAVLLAAVGARPDGPVGTPLLRHDHQRRDSIRLKTSRKSSQMSNLKKRHV